MLFHAIRIKRLDLESPQRVCSGTANFDRLAWFNPKAGQVFNAGNPFIAQTINAQPFEQNLILGTGVHLHFILPQALTRFSDNPEDVLPAPDRWLVRKITTSETWVIESDYLSAEPQFHEKAQSTTLLPVDPFSRNMTDSQPFKYMGRVIPLKEYLSQEKPIEKTYWKDLLPTPFTAFAHGDVHFSAFYPNCSSVFGFHDPQGLPSDRYEVVGWYETNRSDTQPKYLSKINDFLIKKDEKSIQELENQWGVYLTEEFSAYLNKTKEATFSQVLFYGKTFQQDESATIQADKLTPVLGNGSDEAFSTFLAHTAGNSETEKNRLERELEALHFGYLKQQTLDLAPDFESGRHGKGFVAESGMFLFDLVLLQKDHSLAKNQENTATDYPVHLPEFIQLREEIESLNKLIKQQEKNELEIADKRRLLFSHWQKYLQSAHPPLMTGELLPDSNHILNFIAEKVIPDLKQRMQQSGKLNSIQHTEPPVGGNSSTSVIMHLHAAEMTTGAGSKSFWQYKATQFEPLEDLSAEETLAGNIIQKLTEIRQRINDLNVKSDLTDKSVQLMLQHRQGQTYYTPIQPTLLLAGESLRHLIPENGSPNPTVPLSFSPTEITIDDFLTNLAEKKISADTPLFDLVSGIREFFVPLFLDWEAYFFPIEKIGSRHEEYYKHFISDCFEIRQEDAEFSLKKNTGIQFSDDVSRYVGRTIPIITTGKNIRDKLNGLPDDVKAEIPKKVVRTLDSNGFLVQTLDGLNAAFVQEKTLMQLPVGDPIAFLPYKEIFQKLDIQRFIGDHRFHTPDPEFDFSPIRSGGIHLSAIELINTFGITTRISPQPTDLLVPETMSLVDRESLQSTNLPDVRAFFYPRFMQATALSAYWLNAASNSPIYTEATNANPVCGWLVPNFMTQALAIYTTEGEHLCNVLEINKIIRFEPGPDRDTFHINLVENKYLKQVLQYLKSLPSMDDFLTLLQESLLFIDPESASNHNDLNYMFGRPLALARMQINFETKGVYASQKDHYAFRDMLKSGDPEPLTANYESVSIPLQIGDYTKLNEGVVIYWNDLDKKELYSSSISPSEQSETDPLPEVKPRITHALKSDPVRLTLLIDPRAEAHISSGVVPLTVMKLDEQFWKPVLQRLRIDFDMGPGLFPRGEIRLNLPNSSDYGWAWLQKRLNQNREPFFTLTPQLPAIRKEIFEREKRHVEKLNEVTWEELEDLEIILPTTGGDLSHAFVKFENCRPDATTFSDEIITELLSFFDKYCTRISPVETNAEFKINEFHDGWLELYDASYLISDKKSKVKQ